MSTGARVQKWDSDIELNKHLISIVRLFTYPSDVKIASWRTKATNFWLLFIFFNLTHMIPKHVWSAGPYEYTHTVRPYAYGRTVRVYVYGPDRTRTVQILVWF